MEDQKQQTQQQNTQAQQTNTQNQTPQQQQNCTIFIGDIDEKFDESQITAFFNKYGPIKSVNLRRDPLTKFSKGYCFIEYTTEESAQKAIKQVNGVVFGGKPIRVVEFKNPRELNPDANIFISKIDSELNQTKLTEYFSTFGKVISIRINSDAHGQSLGYGYLQFESSSDADKVIGQNVHTIGEKKVEVCKFIAKKNREVHTEKKVVYVSNIALGENLKKENLEEKSKSIFEQYGPVKNITLNKDENKDRFYAFISFDNEQQAQNAINSTNNTDAYGTGINVLVSLPIDKNSQEQEVDESNLFSKNIKLSVTEEQLYAAYETYGKLKQIKLVKQSLNPNIRTEKTPLQYAFLYFEEKVASQKALFNAYNNPKVQELYENKNVQLTLLLNKEAKSEYNKQTKKSLTLASNPFFKAPMENPFAQQIPHMGFMPPMGMPLGPMMHPGQKRQGGVQSQYYGKQNFRNNKYPNRQHNKYQSNQQNNYKKPYQQKQHRDNRPQQHNQDQQQHHHNQHHHRGHHHNQQPKLDPADLVARLEAKIALGDQEKQEVWKWLGTQIYPKVRDQIGDQKASKVTGMLVDLDTYTIKDIVETINNPETLKALVSEAVELLQNSEKQQA